jgi:hypothetical protein
MQTKLHTLLVGASCALLPVSAFAQIDFLSGISLGNSGGEILSFYSSGSDKIIASTFSSNAVGNVGHGVRLTQLNSNGTLSNYSIPTIDLSNTFGATGVYSVSSVQVDTQGRDFAVATVIPGNDTNLARVDTVGKAVFFQISTGSILGSVNLGYHPDSVTITPNGQKLLVANEAEYVTSATTVGSVAITQRAGSISVLDLSSVTSASDLATKLGASQIGVTDVGFSGLDLSGIRINATTPGSVAAGDRQLYVEPEYITTSNTKAYVSLQENNAIATLDLTNNSLSVRSLGTLTQTIDNTDRKSGQSGLNRAEIAVNATATGLLMPDTITKFEKGGETYIVTANEGDGRNDAIQSANDEARAVRLNVVATGFEGAGNMFGTRSISIVRASDGAIVWDSSDGQGTQAAFKSFEDYIAANDSATFGMDANSEFNFRPVSSGVVNNFADGMFTDAGGTAANSDTRTDNKGPEPESVAYASINGRDYVFTAMERQGGIFMFDVTDLNNVSFVDYLNLTQRASSVGQFYLSPESLQFVSADQNGTNKNLLLVGFENPTNTFGGLAVLEVTAVPEPSAAAALAGAGVLGLAALRRRRSSR